MQGVTGVAGLLLTGGAGRRMGEDKALLTLGGARLADRAAEALGAVCRPCLEVGPGRSPLPSVREVPPGSGPLAAVAAGWRALSMEHGHAGAVIVLAVDMPFVTPMLLELLARVPGSDAVVPVAGGRFQPLCARYTPRALAVAETLGREGERSMRALLDAVEVTPLHQWVWEPVAGPGALADLDTPADLHEARARIEGP